MNLLDEIPSDTSPWQSLKNQIFGETNWIYKRRLAQFCGNLDAICDEVEKEQDAKSETLKQINSIRERITSINSWSEAFNIEQSLIHLMEKDAVIAEVKRRKADIENLGINLNNHYQFEIRSELKKNKPSHTYLKNVLFRLIKDLQWQELNTYHKHLLKNQIIQRINIFFIFSMAIFFAMSFYFFFFYEKEINTKELLCVSIIAGIFGASFSMLTSIESRIGLSELDELRAIRSWPSLFTRIFAGAGGGLILYFFILSEVVTIKGLPDFSVEGPSIKVPENTNKVEKGEIDFNSFALFVLLSFVAGFAEKLVPGLIHQATEKFDRKDPDPADINP